MEKRKGKMRIVIAGWGEESQRLAALLASEGQGEYEICWIADEDSSCWGEARLPDALRVRIGSLAGAARLYHEGKADAFLVPSVKENPNGWTMAERIMRFSVPEQALLYAPRETLQDLSAICPYEERRELDYMEFHAADHCNLNCKNCSMFSALVDGPVFADYRETAEGLRKLKTFFTHIKTIRILGGEPLLNPELFRYLYLVREVYPHTDIRVITNGILVPKMGEELIQALVDVSASFIVTGYPALAGSLDDMADHLRRKGIRHVVSPTVHEFQKIYNAAGDSDPVKVFSQCNWRGTCANLKGHRISACFVPFVFPYLERAFQLEHPEDETIDLFEEGLTVRKIRERMNSPMDICRFCAHRGQFVPWELTDSHSWENLTDWSV